MTQNIPELEDGGHADGIVGAVSYEALRPQKKQFLPWHKPRKQYVRQYQWCAEIESLLQGLQPDDKTLRYLGLPGDDLLDLRYFHSMICEPRAMALRFLGFNTSASPESPAHAELNVSLDEVKKLDGVDPLSDIIWDNFRLLADSSSKAWHRAKDLGPYDVINFDLCDGFGKHEPGIVDDTYYSALSQLMSLQARRKNAWLLFLTTRTRRTDVHVNLMERFLEKYAANLADCPSFKAASAETLSVEDLQSLNAAATTPEGHLTILLTGVCKWLLGLALAQHPPSKVSVKSVIGYRVYPQAPHDDLISIAFRFEPTFTPADDPMGIAMHSPVGLGECELASDAIKQVAQRTCADQILSEDTAIRAAMTDGMSKLLTLARYDVNAYLGWLSAQPT